jgi:phosphopantothenoylcysteine decarboxylase/phosphopantothenate--cysteine ligase
MTSAAQRFVGPDTFAALTGRLVPGSLWDRPGEVLHVRFAHGHDLAVVAPATANVIAKLALGVADDLLTSTLLEFSGPLVIAPAMHTGMWKHAATVRNVATLSERGARLVGPVAGPLAAGDEGPGRMAEPAEILSAVVDELAGRGDLVGARIIVTAGPTQEPIDPVRFIGNRSTGRMGIAVAVEAAARGADVRLVLGPDTVPAPPGVDVVRVATAEQMHDAVFERIEGADAVVMAAAVADFRPKAPADAKLKKESGVPELVLEPTPDILLELGERAGSAILVGFAAETEGLEAAGRLKLDAKHLDLVVVNQVGRPGTGFGSDTNDALILAADGSIEPLRTWTKPELATAICDRLVGILSGRREPGR